MCDRSKRCPRTGYELTSLSDQMGFKISFEACTFQQARIPNPNAIIQSNLHLCIEIFSSGNEPLLEQERHCQHNQQRDFSIKLSRYRLLHARDANLQLGHVTRQQAYLIIEYTHIGPQMTIDNQLLTSENACRKLCYCLWVYTSSFCIHSRILSDQPLHDIARMYEKRDWNLIYSHI